MNRFVRAFTILLVAAVGSAHVGAQTQALIKNDRTNVRAKPSYDAEVLTSLNRGQSVAVLGEITPAGNREPWSRIAMPAAVTVWAYGQLVNTQAATVKAATLNYRAGPGRNYSVLGELKRGDAIRVIREFDGWLQIEPPSSAVAYVATRLLEPESATVETPVATLVPPPAGTVPATATSGTTAVPTPVSPSEAPTLPPSPNNSATVGAPIPAEPALDSLPTASGVPPPSENPPAGLSQTATPVLDSTTTDSTRPIPVGSPREQTSKPSKSRRNVLVTGRPAVSLPMPDEVLPGPRFVVREGHVEATFSPQAPTDYELRDGFYEEGVLDYLFLEPQKDLRKFSGKRVLVSGHEYQDSRWRTPVLKVQDIQLLP